MYCELFDDHNYIIISDCCKNILNYDSALVIQNNTIECLRPFGITFKNLSVWTFENIEVLQNNSSSLFKVEITLTTINGRCYGKIIYFNNGANFYLVIDIICKYCAYYSSIDRALITINRKNYASFINSIERSISHYF